MIQSTKPALMSGMSAEMPRPAGVNAPVSERPTVTSGSSIFCVNSWQASRKRAALYARNDSSIRSAAEISFAIGAGSILFPRRNLLLVFIRLFCFYLRFSFYSQTIDAPLVGIEHLDFKPADVEPLADVGDFSLFVDHQTSDRREIVVFDLQVEDPLDLA